MLLMSVCSVESDLRASVINTHDMGTPSFGVCQIKLDTANMLGFTGTTEHLMKPEVNIFYAAKYLRRHLDNTRGDICKAVSAYNFGRTKYQPDGRLLNPTYVRKFIKRYRNSCYWDKGNKPNKGNRGTDLERLTRTPMQRDDIVRCIKDISRTERHFL